MKKVWRFSTEKNASITTNLSKADESLFEEKLFEALQILHRSVISRSIKRGLDEIKKGKENGKNRI